MKKRFTIPITRASGGWGLLLVAALVSCSDEPFVGHVSYSQYWEYHNQVQEPLCPTLLSLLDGHAQTIGGKIGLTLNTDDPLRYYKFRDQAAFGDSGCPAEWGACAPEDAVYSTTNFHAHEQAHVYVFRAWGGYSVGLLTEGVAVALSCNPFYELEPGQRPVDVVGSLDWRDLLHLYRDPHEGYGAAGFFVTYLADHYGWQSVEMLYRRIPVWASAENVERAFSDVYPMSIDQAWTDALVVAGAPPCQRDWACMATSMAVGEVASPDCDGEMHRSIDVGAQGGVVLSMDGDGNSLRLLPCADATPTSYMLEGGYGGRPATHWASLPAGTYTMFRGTKSGLQPSVTLRSYFAGPLVGNACDTANVVSLDAEGRTYVDFLAGSVDGWLRFAGGGRSYDVFPFNLFWTDPLTPGPVSICTDCTAASCVPLPNGQATRIVVTDQSVVRFQSVRSWPPHLGAWGQLVFDVAPTN